MATPGAMAASFGKKSWSDDEGSGGEGHGGAEASGGEESDDGLFARVTAAPETQYRVVRRQSKTSDTPSPLSLPSSPAPTSNIAGILNRKHNRRYTAHTPDRLQPLALSLHGPASPQIKGEEQHTLASGDEGEEMALPRGGSEKKRRTPLPALPSCTGSGRFSPIPVSNVVDTLPFPHSPGTALRGEGDLSSVDGHVPRGGSSLRRLSASEPRYPVGNRVGAEGGGGGGAPGPHSPDAGIIIPAVRRVVGLDVHKRSALPSLSHTAPAGQLSPLLPSSSPIPSALAHTPELAAFSPTPDVVSALGPLPTPPQHQREAAFSVYFPAPAPSPLPGASSSYPSPALPSASPSTVPFSPLPSSSLHAHARAGDCSSIPLSLPQPLPSAEADAGGVCMSSPVPSPLPTPGKDGPKRAVKLAPKARTVMNALIAVAGKRLVHAGLAMTHRASMGSIDTATTGAQLTSVDADGGLFAGMDPTVKKLIMAAQRRARRAAGKEEEVEAPTPKPIATDWAALLFEDEGEEEAQDSGGYAYGYGDVAQSNGYPQYPCADCVGAGVNGMHFAAFIGHLPCLEILVEHEDYVGNITDMVRSLCVCVCMCWCVCVFV